MGLTELQTELGTLLATAMTLRAADPTNAAGSYAAALDMMGLTEIVFTAWGTPKLDLANDVLYLRGTANVCGKGNALAVEFTEPVAGTIVCRIVSDFATITIDELRTAGPLKDLDLGVPALLTPQFTDVRLVADSGAETVTLAQQTALGQLRFMTTPLIELQAATIGFFSGLDIAIGAIARRLFFRGTLSIAGQDIAVEISIPIGAGDGSDTLWELRLGVASVNIPSVASLASLIGVGNLVDGIPQQFLGQTGYQLSSLVVRFDPATANGLHSIYFGIGVPLDVPVFDGVTLQSINLGLSIESPLAGRSVVLQAAATVRIATTNLTATLTVPFQSSNWNLLLEQSGAPFRLSQLSSLPGQVDIGSLAIPIGAVDGIDIKVNTISIDFDPFARRVDRLEVDVECVNTWEAIANPNGGDAWLTVSRPRFVLEVDFLPGGRRTIVAKISGIASFFNLFNVGFGMEYNDGRWLLSARTINPIGVHALLQKLVGGNPPDWLARFDNNALKISELSARYATNRNGLPGDFSFTAKIKRGDVGEEDGAIQNTYEYKFSNDVAAVELDEITLTFSSGPKLNPSPQPPTRTRTFFIGARFTIYRVAVTVYYRYVDATNEIGVEIDRFVGRYIDGRLEVEIGDYSLGEIITFIVKTALGEDGYTLPDPWNALNGISLAGAKLFVNIRRGQDDPFFGVTVPFNPPINLGFATIRSVSVVYVPVNGVDRVRFSVDAVPFGQSNPVPYIWTSNQTPAPPVPGQGAKLLDLRFLALGQRLTFDAISARKVSDVLSGMETAFVAAPGVHPLGNGGGALRFSPNGGWVIGADFTVLGFLALKLVFNDGIVAGLALALSGPRSKRFDGLQFEILYKKVSESVGVYQIELRLPNAFRQLEFGQVSITIPVIAIDIYTNGNFRLDFGFPRNNDFSRSFMLQVFPFIGAGGFYLAMLEGETATRLPANYDRSRGTFRPVIEFGLGLSLGIGKVIDKGIFTANLSLTFEGIIEGVLGFFNSTGNASDALYYRLQGSLGVVGRIQGSVDFVVISAAVSIVAYARITAILESYQPIRLAFNAGVNVDLTVRVGTSWLGVDINHSFRTEISEEFSLPAPDEGAPAWAAPGAPVQRALPASERALLPKAGEPLIDMTWRTINLAVRNQLYIAFRPQFAIAENNNVPMPHYVAMLFLEGTPAMSALAPTDDPAVALPGHPMSDFERVADAVLLWTLCARVNRDGEDDITDLSTITEQYITEDELVRILRRLASHPQKAAPFTSSDVVNMLTGIFDVRLWSPTPQNYYRPGQSTPLRPTVIVFPMIPELMYTVQFTDDFGVVQQPVVSVFKNNSVVPRQYHDEIRQYFGDLNMQFQNAQEATENPAPVPPVGELPPPDRGVAEFVFEDYFLLVARSVIEASRDALKNFQYTTVAGDNPGAIAAKFQIDLEDATAASTNVPMVAGKTVLTSSALATVGLGDSLSDLASPYGVGDDIDLFEAFGRYHAFVSGLLTPGSIVYFGANPAYTVQSGDTLYSIAEELDYPAADPGAVATAIAYVPGILTEGAQVLLPFGLRQYELTAEATYADVAEAILPGGTPASHEDLLEQLGDLNAFVYGLIPAGAVVALPGGGSVSAESELRLADIVIATGGQHSAGEILVANSDNSGFMTPGILLSVPPLQVTTSAGDTFTGLAAAHRVDPLSMGLANASVPSLFASGASVALSNIKRIKIAWLRDYMTNNNGYTDIAGIASRFMLPGQHLPRPSANLPTADVTRWMGQPTMPLYVVTGQQVAFPTVTLPDPPPPLLTRLELTLEWPAGSIPWCAMYNGANQVVPKATVVLQRGELVWAGMLAAASLKPDVTIRKAPLYNVDPVEFVLSRPVPLQCRGAFGYAAGAAGGAPTIWSIPDSLCELIARRATQPPKFGVRYRVFQNARERFSGVVTAHSIAAAIDVRIRQIRNAAGTVLRNTYEIDGADPEGIVRLEQILSALGTQASLIKEIHLLYRGADGTGQRAFISNGVVDVGAFVQQTNFSTTSNPDSAKGLGAKVLPAQVANEFMTQKAATLRALWRASMVRSGGFSLYYELRPERGGLPSELFREDGSATVTVLVTFDITDGVIPAYANRVVANVSADLEHEVYLSAEESTVTVDLAATSIGEAMEVYGIQAGAVLQVVGGELVESGLPLMIEGYVHTLTQTHASWQPIADQFGVAVAAITALNPGVQPVTGAAVMMPRFTYWTQPGDTLFDIAQDYDIAPDILLGLNAYLPLFAGGTVDVGGMLFRKTRALPPGHTGVQIFATPADLEMLGGMANGPAWYDEHLRMMFNLLSFRVDDNVWFGNSHESVGKGPGSDLEHLRGVPDDLAGWKYEQIVPLFNFWKAAPGAIGIPFLDADYGPYRGVGTVVQVAAGWRDGFGNGITAKKTTAGGLMPLGTFPHVRKLLVGYTDELIGVERWPSVSVGYVLGLGSSGASTLAVTFEIDENRYKVGAKGQQRATDVRNVAKADREVYRRIYQQLVSGTTQVWLSTSLDGANIPITGNTITSFVKDIVDYLSRVVAANDADLGNVAAPGRLTTTFPAPFTSQATVFPLDVRVGITRFDPVDEGFVDLPGARETAHELEPLTDIQAITAALGRAPAGPTVQGSSMKNFAVAFEEGFLNVKLATGIARNGEGGSRSRLWVVCFGGQSGIGYFIDRLRKHFFAPPPLATFLLFKDDITVRDFVPEGTGDLFSAPRPKAYAGVDLDVWAKQYLSAIDDVLLPEYSVAAQLLGMGTPPCSANGTTCFEALTNAKKKIAAAIAGTIENLAQPGGGDLFAAKHLFEQRLLVRTSAAYETDVIVQLGVDVTSPYTDPLGDTTYLPKLYGQPALRQPDGASEKVQFTASTARIPLENTGSELTFLFRSEKAEPEQRFDVKMRFDVTALEFEIDDADFDDDYTSSRWLTFIVPPVPQAEFDLGIPIPIRSYPVPPSLIDQSITTWVQEHADQLPELADTKKWTYRYTYDRVLGGKDTVYTSLWFNVPPQDVPHAMKSHLPDLFVALAQFEHAWDAIRANLYPLLAKVGTTATQAEAARAERALRAFAELAGGVADAWEHWPEVRIGYAPQRPTNKDTVFVVSDQNVDGEFRAIVRKCQGDPTVPLPGVEVEGTEAVDILDGCPAGARCIGFESDETGVTLPLAWSDGVAARRRTIVVDDIDIINNQNVWAGAFMTRNENLIAEVACNPAAQVRTNENFVYRTPLVRFAKPLTPIIEYAELLDIGDLGTPSRVSFIEHLQRLFEELFRNVPQDGTESRTLRLALRYVYRINPDVTELTEPLYVTLPVILSPSFDFFVPSDASTMCEELPSYICSLDGAVATWFSERSPATDEAVFVFDIAVFSTLAGGKLPIYRVSDLQLELSDVTNYT